MSIKLFPIVNDDAIIAEFKKHQAAGTEMYRVIRCAAFTTINGQKVSADFNSTEENTYKLELIMQGPVHFAGMKPGLYYLELLGLDPCGYRYTLENGDEVDSMTLWDMEHDEDGNFIKKIPYKEKIACYNAVCGEYFRIDELEMAIEAYEKRLNSDNIFHPVMEKFTRSLPLVFPEMAESR